MAATKRQLNWSNVTFTPASGTATTATGVTSVAIDSGGNLLKFSGDGDLYATLVVCDYNEPRADVGLADEAWALGIPTGTVGAFTATHKDAKGASGGGIVFALSPAVAEKPKASGQHRQIGVAGIGFVGASTDGVTNPLSFTLV